MLFKYMFKLNYLSNISLSHIFMIYCFNIYFFLLYFCDIVFVILWVVASELRNFLINGFYRQGSKSIWISNNLLDSTYFRSGNGDMY